MSWGNTQNYRNPSLSNTAILVNGRYTRLHGIHAVSINDEDIFVHVYDAAAAADVTVGSTTPKATFLIPAGDTAVRGGLDKDYGDNPLEFLDGLVIAATEEPDGGNSAPDTAILANVNYS